MWNKMVNILIQLSNKGTFCKMTQRITMISVNIKKKKLFHKDIFSQCFPNLPSQTTLYFCDVNNVHANKLSTTRRVKCIPPPSKSLDYLVACQTVNQYLSQYCSYSCYIIYICGHAAWFPRLDVQSAHSSLDPIQRPSAPPLESVSGLSSAHGGLPHHLLILNRELREFPTKSLMQVQVFGDTAVQTHSFPLWKFCLLVMRRNTLPVTCIGHAAWGKKHRIDEMLHIWFCNV